MTATATATASAATATVAVPAPPVGKALARLLARRRRKDSRTLATPVAPGPSAPSTPDAWLAGLRLGS